MVSAIVILSLINGTLLFITLGLYLNKEMLKKTIKYQQAIIDNQRNVIGNQSATIDNYKTILEQGITIKSDKPIWLTDELCKEIKDLWNSPNTADNFNPRVKATKIIQEKSLGLDKRKLTLQSACELIKQYCLDIV